MSSRTDKSTNEGKYYRTSSATSSHNIDIMLNDRQEVQRKSTSNLNDICDLEMRFKKTFEMYDKECAFIQYFKSQNYPNPYNIAAAPTPEKLMKNLIDGLIIEKRELLEPIVTGPNKGRYPIHFLLLQNHEVGKKILIKLIDLYGIEMYNLRYGEGLYKGESLLHMAIAQNDFDIVKYLLQQDVLNSHTTANRESANINGKCLKLRDGLSDSRVTGIFFKKQKDGGTLYIGKTPLQFAVALGHIQIVKIILNMYDFKSKELLLDIDKEYGTNIFHLLVKSGSTILFNIAITEPNRREPAIVTEPDEPEPRFGSMKCLMRKI